MNEEGRRERPPPRYTSGHLYRVLVDALSYRPLEGNENNDNIIARTVFTNVVNDFKRAERKENHV